jgi:CRP/FNR family cyclic AMP-dependent transcriptional regulator
MTARSDLVRETIWGRELSRDEVERACQGLVERQFSKGSYICHRGDRRDCWTGVNQGLLKLSTISRGGKAITFAGIRPGGWFGEGSVLKNEPRKYDVVALRDLCPWLLFCVSPHFRYCANDGFRFT